MLLLAQVVACAEPGRPVVGDEAAVVVSSGATSGAAPEGVEVEPAAELVAAPDEAVAAEPEAEQVVVVGGRPADFGRIRPTEPVPEAGALTVHALAGYEVVAIYASPDLSSPRLGYLRIGQRTMVTPRVEDRGKGCEKGFHGLPAGGFACASKGLIVAEDKPPYMYMPPPPPRVDAPIPYDYGVVTQDGTPMWWRIPDSEEVMLATQKYKSIVAAQEAAAPGSEAKVRAPSSPRQAGGAAAGPVAAGAGEAAAGTDAAAEPAAAGAGDVAAGADAAAPAPVELTAEERAAIARQQAAARKRAEAREKQQREAERALARKRARLPLNSQTPFMGQGYVVTLGSKIKAAGQTWWKTTRGGFVQASRTRPRATNDFHGGEVPEAGRFALGFVEAERAAAAVRTEKGELKWKRRLAARQLLAFSEEAVVGGRPYLVTHDGLYVRRSDMRMARLATRPAGVEPWERWIDVDLELQLLVAYEGDAPVYATLISSGKKGTAEESFLTPRGTYRIAVKHISSSMDGNTASDGRYSIQDVPWAMFFHGNYALHGAFWHDRFGNRRSHGCVNLGPTDARWLFYWTTPFLPDGWHGVQAHEGAPGSMVVIR